MILNGFELENWGPYKGLHCIHLPSGPIAVTARRDHDPDASNWSGKSWMLGAIRWCLYGARPKDAANEDAVVTRGEKSCRVFVSLSSGVEVTRTRTGGKPKLEVMGLAGTVGAATGDQAQRLLIEHLGMDLAEFDSGLWVGQKAAARLVLVGPSERAAMVESWLGLTKLRVAEEKAEQRAEDAVAERASALLAVAAAENALPPQPDIKAFRKAQARRKAIVQELDGVAARLVKEMRRTYLVEQSAKFDAVAAEGVALRDALKREPVPTYDRETYATVSKKAADAHGEVRRLTKLVKGDGFDGTCPVTCEGCPVTEQVKAHGRAMGAALTKARATAEVAENAAQAELQLSRAAESASDQRARREARLDALRKQAQELEPFCDELEALGDAGEETAANEQAVLQVELREIDRALAEAEFVQRQIDKQQKQLTVQRAQAATSDVQAHNWLGAARVLRLTRRELAEQASTTIEANANKLLSDAGIDLGVEFRWAREGTGLASNCDECGEGFPKDRSTKVCTRCNAVRQPKMVERLDFVSTHRSGAADDLAGLAVQLAAVAYLRASRGAEFATVFVDEPLAHMDASNARAFAIRLQAALPELGFEQALVVAHAPGVMSGFPNQLVVRSDGKTARLEME